MSVIHHHTCHALTESPKVMRETVRQRLDNDHEGNPLKNGMHRIVVYGVSLPQPHLIIVHIHFVHLVSFCANKGILLQVSPRDKAVLMDIICPVL